METCRLIVNKHVEGEWIKFSHTINICMDILSFIDRVS